MAVLQSRRTHFVATTLALAVLAALIAGIGPLRPSAMSRANVATEGSFVVASGNGATEGSIVVTADNLITEGS